MDIQSFFLLLGIYVIGGVTFLPLVLLILFRSTPVASSTTPSKHDATSSGPVLHAEVTDEKLSGLVNASREEDVAAGYFAVCREYVPGGLNGKPPERVNSATQTIPVQGHGVYQSFYKSIFDRKAQAAALEGAAPVRRAANVFFVVLRHGHLLLFDNEDQVEVRHVISLTLYQVSIYGGDTVLPEGELFIKRNCIKLSKKAAQDVEVTGHSSLFLFSENCSEKEDFYHALLQSQRKHADHDNSDIPEPRRFETEHMIKLIRQLHASEDNVQTRWLSALLGRVFLALYKTSTVKSLIETKIKKKIARVPKPTFISSLSLKDVDLGDSAPLFIKPRLKEMAVDGTLVVEVDVKYTGHFRAVVAAIARIDLGQRFKAREVDLVLAGILRKLEGHLLIQIKPPPSNRIWFTFETMPKLDLSLEPIVSTRQITYGVILRAIESRIREVISDTIVYPNWDDIPFYDTMDDECRGGIWADATKTTMEEQPSSMGAFEEVANVPEAAALHSSDFSPSTNSERAELPDQDIFRSPPSSPLAGSQSLRTQAFSTAGTPSPAVVTRPPVVSDQQRKRRNYSQSDAQSTMRSLSGRTVNISEPRPLSSDSSSILQGPSTSDTELARASEDEASIATSSERPSSTNTSPAASIAPKSIRERSTRLKRTALDAATNKEDSPSSDQSEIPLEARAASLNRSFTTATTAARRWGTNFLQRQVEQQTPPKLPARPTEPVGRGKPLPPAGQPLPGPAGSSWITPSLTSIKRKSVPKPTVQPISLPDDQVPAESPVVEPPTKLLSDTEALDEPSEVANDTAEPETATSERDEG